MEQIETKQAKNITKTSETKLDKLEKKIITYIENNPIKIEWDYNDSLSAYQIQKIINSEEGIMEVESNIYEQNMDYLYEIEDYFIKDSLYNNFKEELTEIFKKDNPKADDENLEEIIIDYLTELSHSFVILDTNMDQLLNNTPNLTCFLKVDSNYDCQTSIDDIDTPENYTSEVWKRVKSGVKKQNYLSEFYNMYTTGIFMFGFECSVLDFISLKSQIEKAEKVIIPKGTTFGFFSSFNGSGSQFEHETYRNMTLDIIGVSEYDSISLIADIQQSYNFNDVYGQSDFFQEQNIQFK